MIQIHSLREIIIQYEVELYFSQSSVMSSCSSYCNRWAYKIQFSRFFFLVTRRDWFFLTCVAPIVPSLTPAAHTVLRVLYRKRKQVSVTSTPRHLQTAPNTTALWPRHSPPSINVWMPRRPDKSWQHDVTASRKSFPCSEKTHGNDKMSQWRG